MGWPMAVHARRLVGIDVHVHAAEAIYARLPEPRMAPPARLVAMRDAGLFGRKSGAASTPTVRAQRPEGCPVPALR